MLLIGGVDPGRTGALALWDADADAPVAVYDLPNYKVQIGKKTRTHLDQLEMDRLFAVVGMMGVRMIGVEKVQGYGGKRQSASAAFQFGYTYAKIESAAQNICDVHYASPAVWKLNDKIPLDGKAIVKMADAAFPAFADRFHGPKGGPYHDRAEALFLARYFARRVWPSVQMRPPLREIAAPTKPSEVVAVAKRATRRRK